MQYVLTANGTVGHIVASQSNEKQEVVTLCNKVLDANTVSMSEDVDVCKACENKL